MSLNIPDITIVNAINAFLSLLRKDYNDNQTNNTPQRSLLYLLYNGLNLGKYDLYANIVQIINTTPQSPKHIEAQLSYDPNNQKTVPIIWVTLPSENQQNNSLGVGEGNQSETLLNNEPQQDTYKKLYNYRWATTYQVVIGSENKNETLVLYHLIKDMMVAAIGHFDSNGISNLKIGGGEIRMQYIIPDKIFTRAITLNFEYEQVIPEIFIQAVYKKLFLFWKPEGAIVAQGPIEIDAPTESDSSDSDSL